MLTLFSTETLGDKLRATGNGFVNIGLDEASEVYMFGDYTIEEEEIIFLRFRIS